MSKHKRINEAIARPARTGIQATPAWLLTDLIDTFWDMSDRQFGIVVVLMTMAISYVQTRIENKKGKGLMRQVPPKTAPLVDNEEVEMKDENGAVPANTVWMVLGVIGIVVIVWLLLGALGGR